MQEQEIYTPEEDSFLLRDFLIEEYKGRDNSDLSFLDIGTGSAIIADTAKELGFEDITCTDINKKALRKAKNKGHTTIESDLFENIPKEKDYDIICFNPPYLPEDKREPASSRLATTGGKKGDEISLRFLKEAKKRCNKNTTIYLLTSSITPQEKIRRYDPVTKKEKKISFETLKILRIDLSKQIPS